MGVIVNKEQDNDELTERISADLRARQVAESDNELPDLAEGSDYVKDLQKTSKFGWVWVVLIILAIISLVIIFTI